MGYYMNVRESDFRIKKENFEAARDALIELASDEHKGQMGSGSWQGGKQTNWSYAWVDMNELKNAKDIQLNRRPPSGGIAHYKFPTCRANVRTILISQQRISQRKERGGIPALRAPQRSRGQERRRQTKTGFFKHGHSSLRFFHSSHT